MNPRVKNETLEKNVLQVLLSLFGCGFCTDFLRNFHSTVAKKTALEKRIVTTGS
jgi:hypothetical protein